MNEAVHEVRRITFAGDLMTIEVDGKTVDIDLREHSARLLRASNEERRNFIVSPSGYGIHWPTIDEDLSVDRLVGIAHEVPTFQRTATPGRDTGRKPSARQEFRN